MARMSISVPDGLKARMKTVAEPTNWSAIAVSAFEQELARLAERKKERDVLEVIERLDPSYVAGESMVYQTGFALGEAWARDDADSTDLRKLDNHVAAMGDNIYRDYEEPTTLAALMIGHENADVDDARDWWSDVLGNSAESITEPEFIRGFVEGALAVWELINAQA